MIDYPLTFIIIFLENIAPAFMPPTWMILGFIYNLNQNLNPFLLAFIGAIASTLGRFVLVHITGKLKNRFMDKKRAKKMKALGEMAKKNPIKAFLVMFGLSLGAPIPSNAVFIIVGMSEASSIPIYLGFFLGRLIQYTVLILTTNYVLNSVSEIFQLSLTNIILFDIATLGIVILFSMIDWAEFIHTRKLKFMPFKFGKSKKKDNNPKLKKK
ncbi:MAG: hypothetical protein HY831_02215 [Candidatus Aenigmarchaeota archaeon]|nr:hypothetical protein [Candidatus Aenigmarchaeota archaeon]